MEITSVKIFKAENTESRFRGYATVELDNCFVIRNIRIYETDGKFKLQMPNQKLSNGHWSDCAHPLNQETRNYFEEKIFEEYNNPTQE